MAIGNSNKIISGKNNKNIIILTRLWFSRDCQQGLVQNLAAKKGCGKNKRNQDHRDIDFSLFKLADYPIAPPEPS